MPDYEALFLAAFFVFLGHFMAYAKIDVAAAGQTGLVASPGASKHIRVMGYVLTGAAAMSAKLQSASTDKTGPMALGTSPVVAPVDNGEGWFGCADNEALNLFTSNASQVSGHLVYRIIG